ncbi:pilus assembly protein [Salmonella enterica]|nr:pilus assembly protein [Salmonella enterica]ECZ5385627.1 pilus assembly protein [Salmonella enterica subsp. enterica serovar Montevideo]EBR4274100.1 pilus assembly protein [Salmonella enterica]ECF6666143.1 pilus assembly protein [Salmonella enterica]EFS0968969.1 pilus assembly protein [Salmonella enterica]
MKILKKKYEKGLSLIEASMVLALSAIVVSGVMFYYQSASDSNKTQNTISEVMSTIAAINGLYVGQSDYKGLNTTVLSHSSAIPDSYKSGDGNSIRNPFGGDLLIAPGDSNKNKYGITLTKIPKSSCLNIASMNLGTSLVGVGTGLDTPQAGADTDPIKAPNDGTAKSKTLYKAITPADANSMCDSDFNSITYVMQ